MENPKNGQNINFGNLGLVLKIYGGIIIAGSIITFIITLAFQSTTISTMEDIIQFIEGTKNLFVWIFILSIINIVAFGFILKELFFSARNSPSYQNLLHRSAVLLSFGLAIDFIVSIIVIQIGIQAMNTFIALITSSELMNESEIVTIISEFNQTTTIINFVSLIPSIITFIGYITLYQFGKTLTQDFSQNPSVLKISKGLIFITWGAGISLITGLIDIALMDLIGLILFLIGIFKSGNGFSEFDPYQQVPQNLPLIQQIPGISQISSTPVSNPEIKKYCSQCGNAAFDPLAKFCSNCGNLF